MTRLIDKKCGKCSDGGKLRVGKTIVDMYSLLTKQVLGLVKNDPYCFQCGTYFKSVKELEEHKKKVHKTNK